jgi:dihydroflavonol-4-reductase
MTQSVLLTGISGYIGLHCAAEALRAGYRVRGTVRNASKQQQVRDTLTAAEVDTTHLEFAVTDLTQDDGWNAAAEGCTFVLHVASPFTIANPKSEDDMIGPAVDGTLRVLRAARTAGVKRVVLTSSTLAMMGSMKTGTFGPDNWTDVDAPSVNTYTKSKTLAEKAAWDLIAEDAGENAMELVTINPGGVFGPPLGENISGQSMTMFEQMLRGKVPMVPRMAFPMVDVRDVATLHVRAMTEPSAAGQRLIAATAEPNGFITAAQILNDAGYEGPSTRVAPNFLLRFIALFDREAQGMTGMLGMNLSADNSKTRALFDWTPRPFKQSVLDTAEKVNRLIS